MSAPGLPRDRAFWADNGHGEIVRLRFNEWASSGAPYMMFVILDDNDIDLGEGAVIADDQIVDWDDDREVLDGRLRLHEAEMLAERFEAETYTEIGGYPVLWSTLGAKWKAERDVARRCLAFFASVIKSGESWTATCEKEYRLALGDEVAQ